MSQFLEEVILPELIKPSDKDKLEEGIILLRKTINNAFIPEIKVTLSDKLSVTDFDIISNFVKEKSGYQKYLGNRIDLYAQHKPHLVFTNDKFVLNILSINPIITLFEGNDETKNESLYHINTQQGIPEILLEETSIYETVGVYAHEYTHHTQAVSATDIIKLISNMDDEEKEYTHGIFRSLREGQSLKMEEQIAKLYADKTNDANYYRYISEGIFCSMIKIYNILNSKNKSNVLKNSLTFTKSNQEISDGNIGITYFMLNNLSTENYYGEFINRFIK